MRTALACPASAAERVRLAVASVSPSFPSSPRGVTKMVRSVAAGFRTPMAEMRSSAAWATAALACDPFFTRSATATSVAVPSTGNGPRHAAPLGSAV
ncbi:hypothetical protein BJF81_14210 [Ornithinimicrobium sp. CNJ-824]|nr:hypothetical protein BJF81_14210 [Ornithinimicrobium sp. CNJ-824]